MSQQPLRRHSSHTVGVLAEVRSLLDDLGWGHTIDLRSEVDPTPLTSPRGGESLSAGVATVRANADAALLGAVAALSAVR